MSKINFSDVKVGDSVYFLRIINSELPTNSVIKELKVESTKKDANSLHYIIRLSDDTIITPSGLFAFHTASSDSSYCSIDALKYMTDEIYALSKEECIRIAGNLVKIKMKRLNGVIEDCKNQLDKLGECAYAINLIKENLPIEVMAEATVV